MSSQSQSTQYYYSDYERWDGDWEIIEGYRYSLNDVHTHKHQMSIGNFIYCLQNALNNERIKGGKCLLIPSADWIISNNTVVRPDISVVCGTIDLNDFIRIPPVLIVEVISASTRLKDRNTKFKLYQECGVKYYLMADPDLKKIETFELIDNGYKEIHGISVFQLTVECNISVDASDVFADV